MFTFHDIQDIAIRIETNGERLYREASRRVTDPQLAALLEKLANDEVEHIRWFKALDGDMPHEDVDSGLEQMGHTMLQNVVGDQCFSLEEVDFSKVESVMEMLEVAFGLENDTVMFYQMLLGFVQDPAALEHLRQIIKEEVRHAKRLASYAADSSASASWAQA